MKTRAALLLAIGALSLIASPAQAAPRATIDAIYDGDRCREGRCDPGSHPALKRGATIDDTIEIVVSASSDLRLLEWARLEARVDNDPRWICIDHWVIGQQTFTGFHDWNTTAWPNPGQNSNCPETSTHFHGALSVNGLFHLRFMAREQRVPGEPDGDFIGVSKEFSIIIENRPEPPTWVAEPNASTGSAPSVTLQWAPNPETDMREYDLVREGPGGRNVERVHASKPTGACTRVSDVAIKCTDQDFPRLYGGTYRYSIVAKRSARGGQPCSVANGRCIASGPSAVKSVTIGGPTTGGGTVVAPPPVANVPPPPAPSTGPSPTPTEDASGPSQIAAPGAFEPLPGRSVWGPAAFAFVIVGLAWRARRAFLERR